MTELLMMEAALFQLRAAMGNDPESLAIRISADLLSNAIAGAKATSVNAARVNDIEFALNDLVAAAEDAGATHEVLTAIAMLQEDVSALRASTALAPELLARIAALQTKLRARAKAMERAQYRLEGTEPEPLPHPPEELRADAIPLARQLAGAGFDTPALEALLADPDELRYHTLNEIVDELDVVAGT